MYVNGLWYMVKFEMFEWGAYWGNPALSMASYVLRGDPNGDGVIDLADVVYLINYLYRSGFAPNPPEAGDTNCDGTVDIGDVVLLINYLYKNGAAPGC
jgi:hypothetical protein